MEHPEPRSRTPSRASPNGNNDERRPPGWGLARRIVVPTLAIIGILLLLYLLWELRQLLILAFLALLLAAGLHDPALWLERRGFPRLAAAVVPFVGLAAVFVGLLIVIFPPLITQGAELIEDLPNIAEQLLGAVVGFVDDILGVGTGQQVVDQITDEMTQLQPDFAALAMLPLTLFEALIALGSMLFLSVLLVIERDTAARWFLRFVNREDRQGMGDLGRNVLQKLGHYIRGQLVVMAVVGIASTVGMLVLGVPFALPLGVLAFLVEAIPLVGPFIAAVPILAIAFLESPITGLLMLGWLLVVQQAEGWLLTPLVQGKVMKLSPIAVLLAVFAGATLAGVVGAIIAVPIVAAVDVVLREVVIPLRTGYHPDDPDAPDELDDAGIEPPRRTGGDDAETHQDEAPRLSGGQGATS
jgi:predicted PurR-regulated permease PerM